MYSPNKYVVYALVPAHQLYDFMRICTNPVLVGFASLAPLSPELALNAYHILVLKIQIALCCLQVRDPRGSQILIGNGSIASSSAELALKHVPHPCTISRSETPAPTRSSSATPAAAPSLAARLSACTHATAGSWPARQLQAPAQGVLQVTKNLDLHAAVPVYARTGRYPSARTVCA